MREPLFVDSWFWVGLAVTDDPAHSVAQAWLQRVRSARLALLTSSFVIAESATRLRYDFGQPTAVGLLEVTDLLVAAGRLTVVHLDPTLWQDALGWFRRYSDQRFSVVDCTSFAIMAAGGIADALTADRHFATAGFRPLGVAPPEAV